MAGPWENYTPSQSAETKPWEKYGGTPDATKAQDFDYSRPQGPLETLGDAFSSIGEREYRRKADEAAKNVQAPSLWNSLNRSTNEFFAHPLDQGNRATHAVLDPIVGTGDAAFSTAMQTAPSFAAGVTDMAHADKATNWLDSLSRGFAPQTQTGREYQQRIGDLLNESRIGGLAPEITTGTQALRQAPGAVRQASESVIRAPGAAADATAGALRSSAESLMQSALKPTMKQIKRGDAAMAIDTMLEQDIPLSKKGLESVRTKINDLNVKIADSIKNSNGTVKLADIEPLVKERLEASLKQANPTADVKAVNDAWEEFKNHPLLAGKDEVPVQLAQELKQGTYKQLSKKYGEMGNASVEAQKAIARGLKEGIAKNAPEVVEFNKEESKLLRTLPIMERRLLMDANKNPMGLSLLTHNPVTWAAFMADKSAAFKAFTARILNSIGEKVPFQTKAPEAPMAAPAAGNPIPPPIARPASSIPEQFRTPQEKSRAIRDADQFGMPPGRKLREWYYSDENPNNPLK